ncbi:anaerobic sulfatase maturase [Lachnospira pectinoschiza]|uniref:Radical SAM core domain-containing protein n=1 Tax=Lachnospira pectinoschiza TaxID=28052 RepID=A0A1G9ZHQ1_9FIRM|nr:anaerobic sulfatase maturase [Lachnospira pectinoschiza]SDN20898.1 uncharacterized protein SAMN05216544_2150 [Lachnospira pectinoschiza]
MPAISVLVKPASGNCNLNCDYCFYCDESAKRQTASFGMMSIKTLENVIKNTLTRAEGFYSIAFQGGEPTLCGLDFFKKAVEFLKIYNKNKVQIQIAIQTNGYLIDEKWCRFLKENNILTGISIDGIERIHNAYRHPKDKGNSYKKNIEATKLMDKYGVDYNVLTVIHRAVAENIKEIYKDYKAKGYKYLQFISCLDPLEEERGKEEYSLTPEIYGQFLIDLFDLWYEDLLKGTPPFIRQFDNYMGIIAGYPPESCEQNGVCGIAYTVEANGNVYPCDFYVLDDLKLGNLNYDSLETIDKKRKEISFVERSYYRPDECLNCKWFKLCRGACYRNRFTAKDEELGYGTKGLNYFCKAYKRFFDERFDKLLELTNYVMGR